MQHDIAAYLADAGELLVCAELPVPAHADDGCAGADPFGVARDGGHPLDVVGVFVQTKEDCGSSPQ